MLYNQNTKQQGKFK